MYLEAAQVDYFSNSHDCWMPAMVSAFNEETGAVQIDVKPGVWFDIEDQRVKLRERTKPTMAHHDWARDVLREGRIEQEAQKVFCKYAVDAEPLLADCAMHKLRLREAAADGFGGLEGSNKVLRQDALRNVGLEVDRMLGVSGSTCQLKHDIMHCEGEVFSLDAFTSVFWELLWGMQKEYGQALRRELCVPHARASPTTAYSFRQRLGEGSFGTVDMAIEKDTGAKRAIKSVEKTNLADSGHLQEEVENLIRLDHPNVVKLYEHYEDQYKVYLVMDYCSGGDLATVVRTTQRHFNERWVRHVMRQVLMAVAHVHAHGIVHSDLKAANIMLTPDKRTLPPAHKDSLGQSLTEGKPHVMVIDFGVAQLLRPGGPQKGSPLGTPITMAPEAWLGEITPKADIFGCGCILFLLLSLQCPWADIPGDIKKAIQYWKNSPNAPWDLLQRRGDYAVGLCRRMMLIDRHRRPTASKCLQSQFLKRETFGADDDLPLIPSGILDRLRKAPKRTLLQKSVALAIARKWPSNQIRTIKTIFQELDKDGTGRLNKQQIASVLEGVGLDEFLAQEVADAMDLSRDGTIDWTEFVASCIHLGGEKLEADLERLFNEADGNGDGLLDKSDLAKLLPADVNAESGVLNDILAELVGHGNEESARVDWRDFRRHFLSEASVPLSDASVEPQPQSPPRPAVRRETPEFGLAERMANGAIGVAAEMGVNEDMMARAIGWLERAHNAISPAASPAETQALPDDPAIEKSLQRLGEMGFSNREKCAQVLRKHRNDVTNSCIEELVADP